MRFLSLAAAALILAAGPTLALAHAHLDTASPSGTVVEATAPTEIVLGFTERLELSLAVIEVTDAAGTRVDDGAVRSVGDDGHTIAIGLKPLGPGTYLVSWAVTSVDTHRSEGSYSFVVGP